MSGYAVRSGQFCKSSGLIVGGLFASIRQLPYGLTYGRRGWGYVRGGGYVGGGGGGLDTLGGGGKLREWGHVRGVRRGLGEWGYMTGGSMF